MNGQARRNPNILLVSFDALRRDFVSTYGGAQSSALFERVASSGLVFSNAITNANWTVPSHASLFTGLEPQAHRIFNWRQRIPEHVDTIFDRARRAGYRTAFLASEGVRKLVDNRQAAFEVFGATRSPAAEEIAEDGDASWCVFWHFLDTHAPYNMVAPRPPKLDSTDFQVSDPTINYLRELVCTGRIDEIKAQVRENFRDASEMVSRLCGRLGENTIVVLCSDHGEDWRPFHPFHCSFEVPVLKIPLVLSAPGLAPLRDHRLVAHADVPDFVWSLAQMTESARQQAYLDWQPNSQARGRVAVCGPDSFDNAEVFFAACTGERMILEKPSTSLRRYFSIAGGQRDEQAGDLKDPVWAGLNVALDQILEQFRCAADDQPELSNEDTELLLERLEKLGYI